LGGHQNLQKVVVPLTKGGEGVKKSQKKGLGPKKRKTKQHNLEERTEKP